MTSRTGICLIALALAIVLWKKKKGPKPHAVAAFVAVAGLAGGAVGGWIPRILLWITKWLVIGEDKLTQLAFGGTDPGLVASILAATAVGLVIHDLMPKHSANRTTVIIAAVAPIIMLAAGHQWAAFVHGDMNLASSPAVVVMHAPTAAGGES